MTIATTAQQLIHGINETGIVTCGTSKPEMPVATASGTPPVANATVGRPLAAASIATIPNPSTSPGTSRTGKTCTALAAYALSRVVWGTGPRIRRLEVSSETG